MLVPIIILSTVLLGGCATAGSSVDPAPAPGMAGPDRPVSDESGADSAGGGVVVGESPRQVIVTGYLTMTVDRPMEAAADVARIVEQAGGRIDARTETAPKGKDKGSAQLTVRIPTEQLTPTLELLKRLGEVERVDQTEDDVSAEAKDLDARITALRTSVDRLIALMADADSTADLISIEAALSERQSNLESLEAQKRSLDDQVEMSTFTVYLGSVVDAPIDEPDTFLSGLAAGWNALVGFVGFLLIAFGVLLPWLALVGVALLVILLLVRRRGKTVKPSAGVDGL